MDFEKKVPEWSAEGTEPPSSLKTSGFQSGYKPPAAYFNWFWNRVSACLAELQAKVKQLRSVPDGGTGKSSFTPGSYLVGNGSNELAEKTPEEVRVDIGAATIAECIPIVRAYSEDGIAYTATVPGVTELSNGMLLTIIPDVVSASTAPTLNINGLGDKMIRLPLSFNNAAMSIPKLATYFTADRPITLQYDAFYLADDGIWKTFGKQKTSAQDLYGLVPVESGGTGADNPLYARRNLGFIETVPFASDWVTSDNSSIGNYMEEFTCEGVTKNAWAIIFPGPYDTCDEALTMQKAGFVVRCYDDGKYKLYSKTQYVGYVHIMFLAR